MEAEHDGEERGAFAVSADLARVGVDGHPGALGALGDDLPRAARVGGDVDALYPDAVGQGRGGAAGQFADGQGGRADTVDVVQVGAGEAHDLVLEDEHGAREADERDDEAERKGEPKVEFAEEFSHKA